VSLSPGDAEAALPFLAPELHYDHAVSSAYVARREAGLALALYRKLAAGEARLSAAPGLLAQLDPDRPAVLFDRILGGFPFKRLSANDGWWLVQLRDRSVSMSIQPFARQKSSRGWRLSNTTYK